MKYRKLPIVIDAVQWFKNGDHPQDGTERFTDGEFKGELYEGKVVRYFRRPDVPGDTICDQCKNTMHVHGWIDTLEGGHTVCPGDWIITGIKGECYPCKPDIFAKTYEPTPAAPSDAVRDDDALAVCQMHALAVKDGHPWIAGHLKAALKNNQ